MLFCVRVCALYPEIGKKLWICIKQSATRRWHAWLVLLLWATALEKCFLSFSKEQGNEGEKKSNLMGTLSFSLCGWKTNTLMMQTHMQRSTKPSSLYTSRHKKIQIYTPNHAHKRQSTQKTVCKHFSKCTSREYSALLSNSFRVCC